MLESFTEAQVLLCVSVVDCFKSSKVIRKTKRAMQRVRLYNDLLHLTDEWMNADMLNRGTEDPASLSLSFFIFFKGGDNMSQTENYHIQMSNHKNK
jgi:hypothetical protein